MKLPQNSIRKIAVFRALQLGDMLCAIPAIRALRSAYPEAEIVLLGLPWAASLPGRFPRYFDRFVHFPGYPGLPEQAFDAKSFSNFLAAMQREEFDLALQMQGNGSLVNPMMELLGAKYTAGFRLKHDYAPDNSLFLEYPEGIHETGRHLQLMEFLGIPSLGSQLEFPIYPKDLEDLSNAGLALQPKQYVCVHPGSRGAWRQWPPEYFAKCADYCASKGLTVVLTGTQEEMDVVNRVWQHMKYEPVIAAGKTSVGAAAAMIKDAFALISNCTGVSHIAAALEIPSIVISMDGEPERWAPANKELHRTTDWTQTPDFDLVFSKLKHLVSEMMERNHFRDELRVSLN